MLSITKLFDPRTLAYHRGLNLFNERKSIPIDKVSERDRTQFVAWMIRALDDHVAIVVEPFAKWLFDSGFRDFTALEDWEELTETENLNELSEDATLTTDGRNERNELVGKIRDEIRIHEKESRDRSPSSPPG